MDNKKVVIGGTFDTLHEGHKALLRKAFELGSVSIGLVSGKMAEKMKGRAMESFSKRRENLKEFGRKAEGEIAEIIEIHDKFGFAADGDFDYIVVSPATYGTALEINKERQKREKKPLEIVKIDFVVDKEGTPISSTRIFNGEIDKKGGLLK
jgi:pantetheine-phosphate adenylyltransferase